MWVACQVMGFILFNFSAGIEGVVPRAHGVHHCSCFAEPNDMFHCPYTNYGGGHLMILFTTELHYVVLKSPLGSLFLLWSKLEHFWRSMWSRRFGHGLYIFLVPLIVHRHHSMGVKLGWISLCY